MNDRQNSIRVGNTCKRRGFTLIELSIVLVIIALIIGGILVGKDLIAASVIRAQVSQFEKYNTAVNTFKIKFNWLPGDMPSQAASALGFMSRRGDYGEGDGNGSLQVMVGYHSDQYQMGELMIFWNDLATAQLIGDPITGTAQYNVYYECAGSTASDAIPCFPQCKLGGGACFVRIFTDPTTGVAYYFLSNPGNLQVSFYSLAAITPAEAFSIDLKIDDGNPFTGKFTLAQPDGNYISTPDTPAANACAVSATAYNVSAKYANQILCVPNIQVGF